VLITVYFWWRNTRGRHESSDDALRIMYVTTVMVVMLIVWSGLTIITSPPQRRVPPAPVPQSLTFDKEAVGWLPQIAPSALREESVPASRQSQAGSEVPETRYRLAHGGSLFGLLGILIAFGHSLLRCPVRNRWPRSTASWNIPSTRTSCVRAR
jgi:hypothetical protein